MQAKAFSFDNVFWGLRGVPADVADVGEVVFLISLMEHDNGDPDAYRAAIELVASGSLGATIGEEDDSVRAEAFLRSIRDALEGINLPLPLSFDEDHIGTQSLGLKNTDLVAGGFLNKQLRIESDEGRLHPHLPPDSLAVRRLWAPSVSSGRRGAEEGVLGLPMGNEAPTFDGAGRAQQFAGGIVAWHGALGAHTVWGLIGQRCRAATPQILRPTSRPANGRQGLPVPRRSRAGSPVWSPAPGFLETPQPAH
jgi:hypothetical protein